MLRLSEKKIGVRLTFITDKTSFPKKNGRNAYNLPIRKRVQIN